MGKKLASGLSSKAARHQMSGGTPSRTSAAASVAGTSKHQHHQSDVGDAAAAGDADSLHHQPSTSAAAVGVNAPLPLPICIAYIKAVDNAKLLPRYSAALGRPHDDSMPPEDLDAIQTELEKLLSTVARRAHALRLESLTLERGGSADDLLAATSSSAALTALPAGSGRGRESNKRGKDVLNDKPISPGKRKRGAAAASAAAAVAAAAVATAAAASAAAAAATSSSDDKKKEKYYGGRKLSKLKAAAAASSPNHSSTHSAHRHNSSSSSSHNHHHHHHQHSTNSSGHLQLTDDSMDDGNGGGGGGGSTRAAGHSSGLGAMPDTSAAGGSGGGGNAKMSGVPKTDVPNKFWLSVEPYCMPISHEDIKLLDDLIEEYNAPLVPAVPELGPHYSQTWAQEDMRDELDSSNANAKANRRFTSAMGSTGGGAGGEGSASGLADGGNAAGEVMGVLRKGEKLMGEQVTGPLTQRLMAALVEENVLPDTDTSPSAASAADAAVDARPTAAMLRNGVTLERRIRQELIDQGLLSDDEDGGLSGAPPEDDEIFGEIMRVRTELATIAEYNYTELQKLRLKAKTEMRRLEVKRQLDVVDQRIVEMYMRVADIKQQKRRALSDDERAEVLRLTGEQKRLSDQLETFGR